MDHIAETLIFELSLRRGMQEYLQRRCENSSHLNEFHEFLKAEIVNVAKECETLERRLECHLLKRASNVT